MEPQAIGGFHPSPPFVKPNHHDNSRFSISFPPRIITNGRTRRKQRMVVAEENGGTQRSGGFWTNLWGSQEPETPSKVKDNGSPNVFWDSFASGNGSGIEDLRGPIQIGWGELLDPKPQNMLAVGLTVLLSWATLQILWQLFFVSLAIIVAALKYSLIAAILLLILVTLL